MLGDSGSFAYVELKTVKQEVIPSVILFLTKCFSILRCYAFVKRKERGRKRPVADVRRVK